MAAPPRYRIRQTPTDVWSTRERLCLASSVLRSGDQNWVSVSRAIKPFGEPNRPPDWFSQKNCALQYSDLLEKIEAPKRKRWERADKETPGDLIVRKLTIERMEELKKRIQETQVKYKKKKREVEIIRIGHSDDQLDEIWNRIKEEVKAKEASEKEHKKWLEQREARIAEIKAMPKIGPVLGKKKVSEKISRVGELRRRNSSQSELSEQDSAAESPISESPNIEVEDAVSPTSVSFSQDAATQITPTKVCATPVSTSSPTSSQQPTPSTSPLLTSLLKSPTPTTPVSPIASGLVSPLMQPKEGTLATPHASPRSTSAPQSFFNPSSALATAAARQLAVATSSVTPSISPYSFDKQDSNSQVASSVSPVMSTHSVTLSAPTLSKLLEMPPSIPGKLPPLPIVHSPADKAVPASTIENESSEINTVDQVLTPTVNASLPIKIEMDSTIDTSVSGSPSATLSSPPTDTIEVQVKMEIENDVPDVTSSTDLISEKEIESNVILGSSVNSLECTSQGEVKNEATCTEPSVEVIKLNTSVLDNKDDVESQELQQVIVMEVDFTGEVKDGKTEIIEVFELTAAEGSIVELEYETICDDEVPIKEAITEVSTDNKSFSEAEYASEPTDVLQNVEEHKENRPLISLAEEKSMENTSPCEIVELVKEVETVSQAYSPVQVKTEESSLVSAELESSYVEFKIPDKAAVLEDRSPDEIPLGVVAEEITPLDEIKMPKNDTVNEKNLESDTRKSLPVKIETNQLPQGKGSFTKISGLDRTEHKLSTALEAKECDENVETPCTSSSLSEVVVKSSKRFSRKGRKGRGRPPGKSPASVERDVELTPPPPTDTCIKIKEEPEDIEEKYIKTEQDEELEANSNIKLEEDADLNIIKHVEESITIDSADQILGKGEDDSLMSENDVTLQDSLSQDEVASPQQLSSNEEPSISEDKYQPSSSITDSIPNSPASTAPSDDQETLREYKVWKKAIMLVWRAAANHKFANVFLHPVTNDVAPGYHSIVYRPMDLSVIKKNIENGVIRSTIEFQRDMMLMFQNAIMYNSSDHDVYHMALEMQKEVMEQIQDFLATQLMLQTAESKVLRGRERETRERKTEPTDKEEDIKRKRPPTSAPEGEPKTKKRKT